MNNLSKIPKFKNEDAERAFWAKADSSLYFDFSKAKKVVFPNLKPSSKPVSIRLPEMLIYRIKASANKMGVPYQTLIKQMVAKGVSQLQ